MILYAKYNEDFNKKDPKFKVVDHARISKYKNIFAKGFAPNWSEEVKIKKTVPWTYVISDLNCEEITGSFHEKELLKISQEKFRIEKVLKNKGDKLSNGKGMIIHLILGLMKKIVYKN